MLLNNIPFPVEMIVNLLVKKFRTQITPKFYDKGVLVTFEPGPQGYMGTAPASQEWDVTCHWSHANNCRYFGFTTNPCVRISFERLPGEETTIRIEEISLAEELDCGYCKLTPVFGRTDLNGVIDYINELVQDYRAKTQQFSTVTESSPAKPSPSEPLDRHFDYYHECKKRRIRYTLRDLASDVNMTHGYIRQEHAKYMDEHRNK